MLKQSFHSHLAFLSELRLIFIAESPSSSKYFFEICMFFTPVNVRYQGILLWFKQS